MPLTCDRRQLRHYGDEQGRYYSVSQVCRVLAGEPDRAADPLAAQRGTDLHQIFALLLAARQGLSEPPVIPAPYQGYVAAMQAWIGAADPQAVQVEVARRHPRLPYAGTIDCVGLLQRGAYGVLDLKTGQPARWHAVQIRAYRELLEERAARMWILYVHPDGTYRLDRILPRPADWLAFQHALNVLLWRET